MTESNTVQKPSNLWYVLPLFLGIIGGLLGYFILKDRDKSMAKNILIFGTIWTVIILIVPNDDKNNNKTPAPTIVSTQKEYGKQPEQLNEDKLLKAIKTTALEERLIRINYNPDTKIVNIDMNLESTKKWYIAVSAVSIIKAIYKTDVDIEEVVIVVYGDYVDKMGNPTRLKDFQATIPKNVHNQIKYENIMAETAVSNWKDVWWSKNVK